MRGRFSLQISTIQTEKKGSYLKVFLFAIAVAAVIFLPFLIYDKGYFLFYGDFNVQQIPFYQHAHDSVLSGNIFWDWNTDLGANFIGSYTFYLLTSPFFWLTLLFPSAAVNYLMAPLLILKFGVAAVTSYAYIRRFCKNVNMSLIGALLYAFSGFDVYNVFFNHFNDVTALFPLLLLSLEFAVVEKKRGVFGLMVFVMASLNYFFFAGQVAFLVLYFFARMLMDKDFRIDLRTFISLAIESILGVGMAAVVLIPSYLAIADNPRTFSYLTGFNFWLYGKEQRYPNIIASLFFPPDIPARPNFFPDADNKWASLSAYLPLFTLTGVIAYMKARPKRGFSRLLVACLIFALIPGLNSVFYLLNGSYYARWFYMPLLIMATMTSVSLDEHIDQFSTGIKWTAVGVVFFTIMVGLTPTTVDGKDKIGLYTYPDRFWIYVGITVVSLIFVVMLVKTFKKEKHLLYQCSLVALCFITVFYSIYFIALGKTHSYDDKWIIETALHGKEHINLNQDAFYRTDVYEGMDNEAMFWDMPTIQAFHSIVPASIMEFYTSMGIERSVGSRPDQSYHALRSLLSVKYCFVNQEKADGYQPMDGFTYYTSQNGFDIYENEAYIPMGFTYDYYITESDYKSVANKAKDKVLLKAILLEDGEEQKNSDLLTRLPSEEFSDLTTSSHIADARARAATSAYSFETDSRGFTAKINLERENLVFFSVPYDKGFTATVNGQAAEIIKCNKGFMAVRCPAGQDITIRFDYMTPGLIPGLWMTGGFVALFLIYLLWVHLDKRRHPERYEKPAMGLAEEDILSMQRVMGEHPVQDEGLFLSMDLPARDAAIKPPNEAEGKSSFKETVSRIPCEPDSGKPISSPGNDTEDPK